MATESRRKGIKLVIALCVIVALAVTGVLIWTSRRATVRFYSEVESNIENMSVSIGGTIDQPKDPVAKDPGYSFGGWYSDANYLTEFDFDLPIQKDTTVYVKWVRKSFTVTVLRATTGGNFYEILWTGSAKYKESISLPGESTFMNYSWMGADDSRQYPFRRSNQNFLGFATKDNGIGDYNYTYLPDSSFTIPNTSVQLYAVFRGDERSFIFKPNDGEGAEKTETGYFNENFTVPTSEGLSKKYYTFAYWCTNADGIPRDSEGNVIVDIVDPVTGEVTEKAENNENCVNVYWPGQTFKIKNTEPMTLYAIWERNKVNIMIDARGGTNSLGTDGDNLVDAGLEGGYNLGTITKPTRDGYRLMSYNTQPDGLGTSYSLDAVLQVEEEDIALYAIWQRHLTVGYTLNSNKVSDDKLTESGGYDDFVGIDGESFVVKDKPVTAEIPNFEFLGWSLNSEATQAEFHSGDTFVLKESDFADGIDKIYLYGIWQGGDRVLRLKNTSDNQVQDIPSKFGRMERLVNIPIHIDANYMFVGWGTVEEYNYKNPDSYTGKIYEIGSQFEVGTNTEIGESRDILYSLWCPYSYDITYYTQGGKLTAIKEEDQAGGYYTKEYVYKERITLYSQVEREGYRFMGWAYSANSQECAFPTEGDNGYSLVMPGNPIQLYAVWQKEYTITFYNNSNDAAGLVTAITGKILGETITIPTEAVSNASITRENYKIIGWGSKPDGGTVYEFGAEVTLESSDMVSYYAIWQGDARYIEIYNGVNKVTTIEGHYGEGIAIAFEDEIADADPGKEIGGFYALIKINETTEEKRSFNYGDSISTTSPLYFPKESGVSADTLKLYIEWTNKYFSVVYELNGGIYNDDENDDMSAYRIYKQYTTTVTLESGVPTKTRYEFKGWTETPDDDNPVLYAAGAEFTIPSHDVTLYAYWARIYSINFSSNGGVLAEGEDEATLRAGSYSKGTNFIIPNNVYERTNYTFKCWSTRATGATGASGEDYNVGDTLTITSDITLYAVWQGQEVNVTLISTDPGNAAYETRTVKITPNPRYGDTISLGTYSSLIPAPDQGLSLKGWVIGTQPTDLDIDVEYTNDYTIDTVGNIEIYAVWSAKKFYFTVGLSGGVCNNSYSDQAESYAFRQKIDMSSYSNRIKKEGYRLVGYANAANATTADYAVDSVISMPNTGKKVFCVWMELAIITFDKNCESDTLENYVFEGVPGDVIDGHIDLVDVNKKFARDNYTLLGWSTSSTATTPDAGFSIDNDTYTILSTQDIHLYAVWEGRTIQVVFNANGGQGSNSQKAMKYGDVIDLTTDEYKRTHSDDGFSFGGWSKTSGYDNANATVGSSFTVATDNLREELITLYAIWNKRYFTLTLSYGDSTLGSKATPDGYDSRQVQYTSSLDLTQYVTQAKKRLGYDFLGWAENQYETNASKIYGAPDADGNPTNVMFTMPNSSVTLYALWNPIYVDVIYISDTPAGATATWSGVTAGVQSYTSKQLYQLSFKLPSNKITESVSVVVPTYRFVGWILEGDSTQTIRKEGNWLQVSSRSPMTLRAQWEENRITVSVNGNGGIFTATSSGTLQTSIKEMGTYTIPTSTELVREGYRLSGYTVGGNKYDIATNPTLQITTSLIDQADIDSNTVRITMLWIQQFTVSFNANNKYNDGTTGSISDRTVDSGTSIVMPNCSATEGYNRPHYKFMSWNTEPDGKGTTYNAGISVTVYGSYVFYAIWEGDSRSLTLNFVTNMAGKSTEGTPTKTFTGLKYGDEIDLGKNDYTGECTNSAYKLAGWTDVPYDAGNPDAFKVRYLFGSIYTIEGEDDSPNIQLYAVWEARSYKISYDTNGGIFTDGTNRKDGTEITYGNNFTIDSSLKGYNPSATKQFYTLVGWSTDRSFSWTKKNTRPSAWLEPSNEYNYVNNGNSDSAITGFKMPSRDVVLYAIWEPVEVNISIYNDKDSMGTVTETIRIRYGDTFSLKSITDAEAALIKADHNFDKWQHLDIDKSTILGSYSGGTTLKVSEDLMSENEETAIPKTLIFVGTWIPQTVYFVIDGNEGLFGDNNTHTVQSSVGREITLPNVKETDTSYQLIRENFALDSFNTNRNGSGAIYKPGSKIQIPSLTDSRVKEETITFGDEEITTYVFRVYAQWVDAEAYIYLSDNRKENPFYKTLGEAIDDAASGNRVIIIKDCYISSKITISKSVTLEAEDSDKTIYRYIGSADSSYADAYKGVCIEVTTTGQLNLGTDNEDYDGPVIYFDGQSAKYSEAVESFISLKGGATIYNGVVFRNTYATSGGAFTVDNTNASLVLKYVSFDSNSSSGNGGAINIVSANNVSIENSNFHGNISKRGFGGAIANSATIQVKNTLFENNKASDSSGGGGAIYNEGDMFEDDSNTYTSNSTKGRGGAIYTKGSLMTVTGTIFTKNSAVNAGGAIYNGATTGTSNNLIVKEAIFGNVDDDTLGNSSNNYGGAISNNGKLSVTSSEFYYNKAANGGAIYNDGTTASLSVVSTSNSKTIFKNNSADKGAGGAINIQGAFSVNIGEEGVSSSTVYFEANTVGDGKGHSLAITGTGIVNIYTANFIATEFTGEASDGGVIYQNQGTLNIYNADVNNNIITNGYGGGLYIAGGTCKITAISVHNNEARYGGGIAVAGNARLTIENAELYANRALLGGGIYIKDSGSTVSLTSNASGGQARIGTKDENGQNTAVSGEGGEIALGGGIYNNGKLSIAGGVVQNNVSEGNAGGIYNASKGVLTLISGSIINNLATLSGGAVYCAENGTVTFQSSSSTRMLIEGNLCADGAYMLGDYDKDGSVFANGIYITNTRVIISGYIMIGLNSDETILNDIFFSRRDESTKPTKIVEFSSSESVAQLSENTRICISSVVAIMGDKLVKFPSNTQAKNNLAKFSFAGDDAGFRVSENYLILGNYAATIVRNGADVYYQSLTEAYLDAKVLEDGTPETIYVYKNIKLADDLNVYETSSEANDAQEALLSGISHDTITSTFYIAKKVIIASGGDYTISRSGLEGDMFTVVGNGQLTLGVKTPASGAVLTIQGAKDEDITTGSIVKVEENPGEEFQLIVYNGVKLTKNKAEKGAAIYSVGSVQIKGGEITNNIATSDEGGKGGAIYSEGYLEMIESPTISNNRAYDGAGIYINNVDCTANALYMNSATATLTENRATNGGGAIYINNGLVTISACNITKNYAAADNNSSETSGGGAIYVYGGSEDTKLVIASTNITYESESKKIQITENESETNGGGILINNATFDFQNGHIDNNSANGKGGGIALINTTTDPTRTLFTTNNSNKQNIISGNNASNGGGIAIIKGTVQLKSIKIGGNKSNSDGGAIYVEDKLELYKEANIGYSGTGGSNFAGGNGGGVYVARTGSVEVKESTAYIGYNEAVAYGGGIANAGKVTLEYIQIYSNKALAGGGIANLDSNANITIDGSLSVYSNTATSSDLGGGGLYNNGTVNVVLMKGSSYIGGGQASEANTSYNGGGIYNSGKLILKRTGVPTTFHALYVRNNSATIYGGGIYNTGTIENYLDYQPYGGANLRLQSNRTTIANAGGGGGICNNGGTIETMLIEDESTRTIGTGSWLGNIEFNSNQTSGYGGGLLLLDGTVRMVDAYYIKNTASYGGAVAVISGDLIDGYKDKYVTYGSQYTQNAADNGNDMYLRVSITFNSNLNGSTDIYLANSRAYLKFNPKWHVEKQSWYAVDTNITVDKVDDGRRVAQFGFYTDLQQLSDGAAKEEVTVYYADEYYLKFKLTNSEEGYGLSVDEYGYIVITEPVCFMGQGSLNDYGKYYSTIAAAVNDVGNNRTANILILKSHTVDQEIVIVNKNINIYTYQNIILTASKRLTGKSMFVMFSTNTDRTWSTTKYTVTFNVDSTNVNFRQYKNGQWTTVYKGVTGKSANANITFDGNRAALKVNASGPRAITAKSGAYYTETETFNGSTRTVYKPFRTDWGFNYSGVYVVDSDLAKGLKINGKDVVRQVIVADDGTSYNSTNFGTTINQQPAMYNITINDCEFNNFQAGYGGAITTYLYSDNSTNNYSSSYSGMLALYRTNFDNNFQRWYHSHEDTYTYYVGVGGGACINASGGRLYINDCKFTNNLSYMSGGAIQARWQTYNMSTSSSKNNTSYYAISITKSIFENNRACYGGAIHMTAVQGIVYLGENNSFNENSATRGGAINYHSSITTSDDFLNKIKGYPISIHDTGSNPMSHIDDTSYNSLNYLYISSGTIFSSNYTTTTGYYDNPTCWPAAQGGAIYATNNIRDYGATYKDNSATSGGAIYASRNVYLNTTKFNNNSAVNGDGGAMNFTNACVRYFFNVKADGNTASVSGGALYAFTNTKMFVISGQSTSFTNNYAAHNGGAIYWHRDYSRESSRIKDGFVILKGEFDSNSAGNFGGAIFTSTACESANPNSYSDTGEETGYGRITASDWQNVEYRAYIWRNVTISNNKAGNAGGGVYAYHNLVMYNVYMTGNEVYNSSNNGGGAGVYANKHLDIIQGTIQNNSITAENKGSGMGGGGVYCGGLLSIGTGYSELSRMGITVNDDGTYSFNEKNIFNTYHSAWEGKVSSGSTKTLRRDSTVSLYLVMTSSHNNTTSVKISENSCESATGVTNGDGTGIYAKRNIYFEYENAITDQVYLTNKAYLSSTHIYFKDTINFVYGVTPTTNAIFIERCSTNNLIPSEIRLMNLVNTGWALAWGTGANSRHVTFVQSSLKIAAYANGWINDNGKYTRIGADDGAKLANGMYVQNATISYNTNAKNLYNQVVPSYSGYSFYYFVYFNNNTVTSTTTPASSTAHIFSYNSDNTFDEATINRNVPKTLDGDSLDVYVIWSARSYNVTIYKYFPSIIRDVNSVATNDSPSGGGNYTYKIKTGEKFEAIMNDFETAPSTVSGAKSGWTKSYYKGYELQYYLDYYTKKVYKKDDVFPYPADTILRAVYSRRTYTMTFLPGDFGTPNYAEGANILKVKYGSRANMLSANTVSRAGYKLVGWIDNNGKSYDLTTNYTAGTAFTDNITLTPKWQAVPYDLRLYYNYPDGGTSFMILSVYAGNAIKPSLSTFTSAPVGYELEGFSFDAEGSQMIDNTTVMPSENTIIYAQWQPRTVTLVFYDKSGNRLSMDIECKYGEEVELPKLPGNPQVKLWENLGDGIYYSEGSSFLVNSMVDRYLTFRMYVD